MLQALSSLLAPAVLERLTLVLNHVVGAEAEARRRLAPHAGRTIVLLLPDWPALLPPLPAMAWQVTPAGLFSWCGPGGAAAGDLMIRVPASNPAALLARALAGERPEVQIEGDAALAGEVNWMLANLRWDVEADLERFFGPVVARQLHQAGRALARGLKAALGAAGPLAARFGGGRGGAGTGR